MKKTVLFLMTLYDPKDMLIAKTYENNDYEFDFTDINELSVDPNKDYCLMQLNGNLIRVSNLEKVRNNKNALINMYLNQIKDMNLQYKEEIQDLLQKKEKALNDKNIFDLVSISTRITTLYQLADIGIEELNKDDNKSNEIFKVMKKCREEEVEKDEEEVRNELDIVNNLLKQHFTDEQLEGLEIQSCEYNGEEIDKADILEELESHVLPNFLIKQKDIRETKGDTYFIKTNLGSIYRESGSMEIKLLEGESND